MIQFCEIINFGNTIRYVTRQAGSNEFDEPVEIEIEEGVTDLSQILTIILNHLSNAR